MTRMQRISADQVAMTILSALIRRIRAIRAPFLGYPIAALIDFRQ
jgi:hypothetical protein